MRAPLKTAVASWAPSLNIIIIIIIIIIIVLTNGGHVASFKQQYFFTNLANFLSVSISQICSLFYYFYLSLFH